MTPFSISFQKSESSNPFTLVAGRHFRFDIEEFERFYREPMHARAIDLLRIASSIYFVDRLVRRRKDRQRRWSRSLRLNVGVLEPDFWASEVVLGLLKDTIEFLSDDTWEFRFFHDDRRPDRELQRTLFPVPADARVCLYSGGLDSAAGLGSRISEEPARHTLPITVWHQPIQRKIVSDQIELFRSKCKVQITPLIVKAAMIWTPELKLHFRAEPTQRARAFLFAATGAVAAAMIRSSNIEVFESGVGAINLPLMSGMVGSRTTRGAHPAFLRSMTQLASLVFGHRMKFHLPFFQHTKGMLVQNLKSLGLQELVQLTVSCVHYPLRETGHKQCGVCPACIFRRQSLEAAGVTELNDTYKYDLFEESDVLRLPERDFKYLKAFLGQVVHLNELKGNSRLPPRIHRHVFGTGVLVNGEATEPISRLLSRYRDEWHEILLRAQRRGLSWTKLVGCRNTRMEGETHALA